MITHETSLGTQSELAAATAAAAEQVRSNLATLGAELKPHYDFIVCGSGSSGSVVAGRLAENADVSVLLPEAGGDDNMPEVIEAGQWPLNLGSERDWSFWDEEARTATPLRRWRAAQLTATVLFDNKQGKRPRRC
jgi:hypothetical protein